MIKAEGNEASKVAAARSCASLGSNCPEGTGGSWSNLSRDQICGLELIHYVALCCSIRDGLGVVRLGTGSLGESRLHYRAWGKEEGGREVGETFRRLSGNASELGVVSEGADQDKVQSFG